MTVDQLWTNNTSPPFSQNKVFWVKGRRNDSPEECNEGEKLKHSSETYRFRRFHRRQNHPFE